jgi:predicted RND superfamily exporter protein
VLADLPQLARRAVHRRALAIVSILCNALMAMLGIGLKVRCPWWRLGVGVGVDYGIYLFEHAA